MSTSTIALISAIAGAIGAVIAALITAVIGKIVVTPFLSARDMQDKEVEWRKHALELSKLDLERKIKSGKDLEANPVRPSILDFLANYRDLQELGTKTPKELYHEICNKRISKASSDSQTPMEVESNSTNEKG